VNEQSGRSFRSYPRQRYRCRVGVESSEENSQMHAFSIIWDSGSNERRDSRVDCRVFIICGVGLGWVRLRKLGFAELKALRLAS
jgi:hypothetical protein